MSQTKHKPLTDDELDNLNLSHVRRFFGDTGYKAAVEIRQLRNDKKALLAFVEDFYAVLGWSQSEMSQRAKALVAKAKNAHE